MESKTSLPQKELFPIVGIGASAGGLEAFTRLLDHLPADTGMGFVIVQHLAPAHESALRTLLSRETQMPVVEVTDGLKVEPNRVHVIPPNASMSISEGILRLVPPVSGKPHLCIDYFLKSLAKDRKEKAIGVILSGTAFDGTQGVEAIKSEGGITFAQDIGSAKYPAMPQNAMASGHIDFVLPPEAIAGEIARLSRHPYIKASDMPAAVNSPAITDKDPLRTIFRLLYSATGTDFTNYKRHTIGRRIGRRMALEKFERIEDFAAHLKTEPSAVRQLFQDLLIPTTSFFRDPGVFQALKEHVVPPMLESRSLDAPFRVWVPACSTGEEVYSIAMCLLETMEDRSSNCRIQIFATDLSEKAIGHARVGIYSNQIAGDVSPDRLRRFFTKSERGYQISKPLRDMCVFARQDVTRDSPFSNLDLISCRNLLIYLEPVLQKKVLHVFHYALKTTGAMVLGTAEGTGEAQEMFSQIDKSHRIYGKKPALHPLPFQAGGAISPIMEPKREADSLAVVRPEIVESDLRRQTDRVWKSFAPPGVVVDDEMNIVEFSGDTGPYLLASPGKASLNLLKMLREGLLFEAQKSIEEAKSKGVRVKTGRLQANSNNDKFKPVQIEVVPVTGFSAPGQYLMILFHDAGGDIGPESKPEIPSLTESKMTRDEQIQRLKEELSAVKEHLQSIIEKHEATNEELQTASEEIVSSNEELQSTNEELETAQEELQASNEELTTLNEELQSKNVELGHVNNDLTNLLSSVSIAIVMVDQGLRIRRFTPVAEKVLNLIPGDLGRPLAQVKSNLKVDELERTISEVIDTVSVREREVQDDQGRWYSMRVRPYKTVENKIDGAVIALIDIDTLKRLEGDLHQAVRSREQFISIASHELRNPLTALMLLSQNALRTFRKGPEANLSREQALTILENIDRHSGRLAKMIENLLDVTRISAGKLQLSPNEMDLAHVVRSVVERFKEDLQKRGQALTLQAAEPVIGRWDRMRIEQVIVNLLTNAIKYGDGKPISVSVEGDMNQARLIVRDKGIGISPEQQKRIFAPFERAVPTEKYDGLGLGLFIARQIVEAHRGSISVTSAIGAGSTFTVELPLTFAGGGGDKQWVLSGYSPI